LRDLPRAAIATRHCKSLRDSFFDATSYLFSFKSK
jgi:hypothetical protein